MKSSRAFAGVLAVAILVAGSAFAADKGSIKLFDPTVVNGTELAPGDYTAQWEGTGNDVQLRILRGKKLVTTTAAEIVQLKTPALQNMTSTRNENNQRTLTKILFAGKNFALAIGSGQKDSADVAKK